MSRFLSFLTLYVCIMVSVTAFCDEGADIEQVKKVLYRYEEGFFSGDAKKVLSCFAPEIVSYAPLPDSASLLMLRGDHHYITDPEDWYIWGVGMESAKQHAESCKYYPEYLKKHPDYKHTTKVSHVSVKNGRAIAVTRHLRSWTVQETRDNVTSEFRTVWMLSKIRGEWKVTGLIAHVSAGQLVTKMRPPR